MSESVLTWEKDQNKNSVNQVEKDEECDRHLEGPLRLLEHGLKHQKVAHGAVVLESHFELFLESLIFDIGDEVDWAVAFLVSDPSRGSAHQQGSKWTATLELLRALHGKMKRGESITVLDVQLLLRQPPKKVNEGDLRVLEACPMERCRASLVATAQIHVLFTEKEKTNRLITLSGDMHHIESVEILGIDISAILDQNRTHLNITPERGIMQRRKLIFARLLVYPVGDFALDDGLFGPLNDRIENFVLVLKYGHMKERVAIGILQIGNLDIFGHTFDYVHQSGHVALVDDLHAPVTRLLYHLLQVLLLLPLFEGYVRVGAIADVVAWAIVTWEKLRLVGAVLGRNTRRLNVDDF